MTSRVSEVAEDLAKLVDIAGSASLEVCVTAAVGVAIALQLERIADALEQMLEPGKGSGVRVWHD